MAFVEYTRPLRKTYRMLLVTQKIHPEDSESSASGVQLPTPDSTTFTIDDEIAMDEALWDRAFAKSQDFLEKMGNEIKAKYLAGLTEDFDPDTDLDLK